MSTLGDEIDGGSTVGTADNRRRWYAIRYLRDCAYPAAVGEVSEYVGPRIGRAAEAVEDSLSERDLPALAACGTVEYDPESGLVCLDETRTPFPDRARRAIAADVLTHRKPPKLKRYREGIFY